MTSIALAQPAPIVEPAAPVMPAPQMSYLPLAQPAMPSETVRAEAAPLVEPAIVVPIPLHAESTPLADPAPFSEPHTAEPLPSSSPFISPTIVQPAIPSEPVKVDPAPTVEPAILMGGPEHEQPSSSTVPNLTETSVPVISTTEPSKILFESTAAVTRGTQRTLLQTLLPLIFDERDFVSYGEVLRYIVIQNQKCFIYPEKSSPTPLFTIPLQGRRLFLQKENLKEPHPRSMTVSPTGRKGMSHLVSVLLTDQRNNLLFQFVFDTSVQASVADEFIEVVQSILKG